MIPTNLKAVRCLHRTIAACFFAITILAATVESVAAANPERTNSRGGLTNFYHKVSQNDTIRVAYFGGSITAAPGWRVKSFNWLKEKYPKCHFVEINAAIGGTGSNLGAFRLANDVLKYKPDLVFVEFVVNDFSTPKISIEKQYEGIMRQIWKENPATDICFVYTIMQVMLEKYEDGGVPESVEAAERIAEYYKIPSVNFAYEVIEQLNRKELIFKGENSKEGEIPTFSKDGVHPFTDTGHEIYFAELRNFMDSMFQMKNKVRIHKIRKPLFKDNWETAKIMDNKEFSFSGDWKIRPNESSLFETSSPGASLSFTFTGTMLGIYDVIGPQGCKLDIVIDGIKYTELRFDKYCTYDRANYIFIPDLKDGIHKVEIKLSTPLSVDEKIEILKERTPDEKKFPENMPENKFRLKQIMIL